MLAEICVRVRPLRIDGRTDGSRPALSRRLRPSSPAPRSCCRCCRRRFFASSLSSQRSSGVGEKEKERASERATTATRPEGKQWRRSSYTYSGRRERRRRRGGKAGWMQKRRSEPAMPFTYLMREAPNLRTFMPILTIYSMYTAELWKALFLPTFRKLYAIPTPI